MSNTTIALQKIDKFRGCLIGQAVGDALGFPSENLSRERIRRKFGRITEYHVRPHGAYYTDDTQLAIMLAECLLEGGGFNSQLFRQKLGRWYVVLPRLSGRSTKNAALKCLLGFNQTGYDVPGSSGAMRIAPLGLFYHDNHDALRQAAIDSCRITHTNKSAIAGALVVSFSVAYVLTAETIDVEEYLRLIASEAAAYDESLALRLRALPDLLDASEDDAVAELLKNSTITGSPIGDIIAAAVFAFVKHHDNFEHSVQFCVNAGWDTDTMAAINGAICGAWCGLSGIPKRYVEHLENGYKGRDYILALSDRLASREFNLPRTNPLVDLTQDYCRNTAFLYHMFRCKPML
ncbi:MAG TPA: ADP-ribosylglycohydrolase family protein [Candidatus Obscuribacterales bacterium]